MNNFCVAVKDGKYITVMDYLPELPGGVELYSITEQEYLNYIEKGYKFNLETKKIEPPTEQQEIDSAWVELRAKRQGLLSGSDWTVLPDVDLTVQEVEKWKIYRQELRDLPKNTPDPRHVVWPISPII